MTAFNKADFDMGHGSERWVMYGPERRFVARFKYARPGANANHFVKFLIKNFTVEEFFGLIDTGMTPAKVLETKGYVSLNTLAAWKAMGVDNAEDYHRVLRERYDNRNVTKVLNPAQNNVGA